MSESDVPQVITKSARSMAAQKRWDRMKTENQYLKKEHHMEKKKFDWSLLIAAGAVVVPLLVTIIGCYVSLVSSIKDVYISLERTKSDLSKEIALVRSDLSQEISKVRTELVSVKSELSKDIDSVRLELSKDMGSVRLEMAKTNSEIDKIKSVLISKELVKQESFVRKEDSYL